MKLTGKSLIAGQFVAEEGKRFRGFNPATGAPLEPEFHEATLGQVDAALRAAKTAEAEIRDCPPEKRAKFLETIAAEIEALGDELFARIQQETALSLPRLQGERARTCGQLRLFAEVVREGSWVDARIDLALPNRSPLPRPDLRRVLRPLGPVGVFGASNFPLAFSVAGGDTAAALAAGCPVIVKAHPAHPGTSELVAGAVTRAVALCGLPAGIFSVLHGGTEIGLALVRHPFLAAVGFTGSRGAGRALFDAASARPTPIPVFAEMSSVNPVVILPGALRERSQAIAQGLVNSVTAGGGQFCTKPGLIFVQRGPETTPFLDQVKANLEAAPGFTLLSSGIRTAFRAHREETKGLDGVVNLAAAPAPAEQGSSVEPPSLSTTSAKAFLQSPKMAQEVFGPFALVIQAETIEEMLACCRSLEGQLTATIHSSSEERETSRALWAELELHAGRLIVNGFPTGVEVSPAMQHGGPYPATTDIRFTSVGTAAIFRFARPVCYQAFPDEFLPEALRNANPLKIQRLVNGHRSSEPIS